MYISSTFVYMNEVVHVMHVCDYCKVFATYSVDMWSIRIYICVRYKFRTILYMQHTEATTYIYCTAANRFCGF